MTLLQLKYIVTVAAAGTISEAAKQLYIAQPSLTSAIKELENKFAGEGRVLIRPSGTEPLVRVMIEGKDQAVIDEEARKLADLIMKVMI